MARTDQITCFGVIRYGGLNRPCSVRGADPRGHALSGVDTHGKRRPETGGVIDRLRIESQRITFLGRERQTDQTPAECRHEINDFRCNMFGGTYQVALVLAVLCIDKHDHAPATKLFQYFRDLTKF